MDVVHKIWSPFHNRLSRLSTIRSNIGTLYLEKHGGWVTESLQSRSYVGDPYSFLSAAYAVSPSLSRLSHVLKTQNASLHSKAGAHGVMIGSSLCFISDIMGQTKKSDLQT